MSTRDEDLVRRVRRKFLGRGSGGGKDAGDAPSLLGRLLGGLGALPRAVWQTAAGHPLATTGILAVAALGVSAALWVSYDYLTKRQSFPIRDVIFHAQEDIYYAGGEELESSKLIDRESATTIVEGGADVTKLGRLLGKVKRDVSDELAMYQIENEDKRRLVHAWEKREVVQGGPRLRGSLNYVEQFGELIGRAGGFFVFSVIPERGYVERQLFVIEDERGGKTCTGELIEHRGWLGLFGNEAYRAGTELLEFADTEANRRACERLLSVVQELHEVRGSGDMAERERLVAEMLEVETAFERLPVYRSVEDGFLDWLPQESTFYLFASPSLLERVSRSVPLVGPRVYPSAQRRSIYPDMHDGRPAPSPPVELLAGDGPRARLRVENAWDLWPGDYWGLSAIELGQSPDVLRPFSHYNNGGYRIFDDLGEVARVEIEDFLLHYGLDVVYGYYLDKNADGRIDRESELIGRVLYRTSRDESVDLEPLIGVGREKRDVTQRALYTFMSGHDPERRFEELYLCNAIDTLMVDALNRGHGKHSFLANIKGQRSSYLLLKERSIANLGRALNLESGIVAKHDILALLRAAGRDYVDAYVRPGVATAAGASGPAAGMRKLPPVR